MRGVLLPLGSIAGLLDACARLRPRRPLLPGVEGTVLTVGDVATLTAAATGWLHDAGVRAGMTVAWQLPSQIRAALLMLALARIDVTQAPIVHILRRRDVAAAIDVAGADLLIVDESTAGNAPANARIVVLPTDFVERLHEYRPRPIGRHSAGADRWIYFTSGSTGRPKGVRHSDATLLAAARGYRTHLGLGDYPGELGSIAFPIGHIGGIVYLVAALVGDFGVLMLPRFTAHELPELLRRHRVTVAGSSPPFYRMLLDAQLASGRTEPLMPHLRMLIGGGAACAPELHLEVRRCLGIPILHSYGMTEAAMVNVPWHTDTDEQLVNSCGCPIPGTAVRIGADEEIEIRGATLTPGYVDAADWDRSTSPDGWFRTGDRGYVRPDGRIVLTGRSKDLIVRKGENIAPAEVEAELLAHPLVDQVAVLGQPDRLRGELVCAVVRRSPQHRDVTLDELCMFLDGRGLTKQKWPERLVIVDEFPLTGLGKVAKADLAERISGGTR